MKVTVAPDFEHLLPKLDESEFAQLEQNCLADPQHEQMPPVLLWTNCKNTIIDGHNQHRIREKHRLKIKYARLSFESRDEALRHALDVQFGRRNLDASQRAMAYAALPRQSVGGDRVSDHSANLPNGQPTVSDLAEAAGVSERTMTSAVKVADGCTAAVVNAVKGGEFTASDAATIANRTKAEQKKILAIARRESVTLKAAAQLLEAPATEPESVEDSVGRIVPQQLLETFRAADDYDKQYRVLGAVKKWAEGISKSAAGSYLHTQSFAGQLTAAQKQLKFEKPYAVCPYCLAEKKKCDACKGRGFVPKPIYDGAPSELRL